MSQAEPEFSPAFGAAGEADRAALDALSAWSRRNRRRGLWVLALGLLSLAALTLDFFTGYASMGFQESWDALWGLGAATERQAYVMRELRPPPVLLAALVGGALALAGTEMQTLLDNPLAEPFTLGVSGAAAMGAGLAIVLGLSLPFAPREWTISANAFVMAFAALAALQILTRLKGGGPQTLILFGVGLAFAFSAMIALVQYLASPDDLQQLVFWTMGSVKNASWSEVALLALVLAVSIPFSLRAAWRLTALRLGEERARGFGVDVENLRRGVLARVSLMAAAAVSVAGIVGFVGLAAPHVARRLVGEDHRFLLPASLFCGASLMSLSSVAIKALAPGAGILPIGLMTTLVGLPVFFILILRRRTA